MTARTEAAPGSRPAPRVTFVGELGCGNFGSDASLDIVATHIRARYPDAVLRCLCWSPDALEDVCARTGMTAHPLHPRNGTGRLGRLTGRLADPFHYLSLARASDIVLAPGSGIAEGEFGITWLGRPLLLLELALACRLAGARFELLATGASPMPTTPMRFTMRSALSLASRRSWRDQFSRASAAGMGVRAESDEVYADVAFAPSREVSSAPPRHPARTILLGVIAYGGNSADPATRAAVHRRYLATVSDLAARLTDRGLEVVLAPGDEMDIPVAHRIAAAVNDAGRGTATGAVTVGEVHSVDDLRRVVRDVDVVLVSRFHAVVAALAEGRPTSALAYSEKSAALLREAGQHAPLPLADLDPAAAMELVDDLVANAPRYAAEAAAAVERLGSRARAQLAALDDELDTLPSQRRSSSSERADSRR